MQQQKLADFLNLESNDEIHMFLQATKKKTSQMKYDEFVKHSLEKFRPMVKEYLDEVDAKFKACETIKQIEDLKIAALPGHIRTAAIEHVDKQLLLNIVERVYLCLDLIRALSGEIGKVVGRAAMHYANAIRALSNLDTGGGRIIGLNGRPLSGR